MFRSPFDSFIPDYYSGQCMPKNDISYGYPIEPDSGRRILNNDISCRCPIEEEPSRKKPETYDEEKKERSPINVLVKFEPHECCCDKGCCDRDCCDRDCCDRDCCDKRCCDKRCCDRCCCDRYCCDRRCCGRCCCDKYCHDKYCCDKCCCDKCCCCDPCGSAVNSATGGTGPLPVITALTTPISVVSVTIDTCCVCNPAVLLNFSTTISLPAASATTLVFQVLRSGPCNGTAVPVGSAFTYTNTVVAATSDTFSFQVFDSNLRRGTYTYSVVLTTGTTATVAGVTLLNSTLSASAGNS